MHPESIAAMMISTCTALNTNGVVICRSDGAWLMRYGLVFMTEVVTSSWKRSWKLTQVQVQ
jgi:hypothetical protein